MPPLQACRLIVSLLSKAGITDFVTSPGTRNAPVTAAADTHGAFELHPVVDERSASFVALGLAAVTGRPVALTCTSGTAVLNQAPGLAEALYRNIPLITITADRPRLSLGRNCGQVIDQPHALASAVKHCFDIDCNDSPRDIVAAVSDALALMNRAPQGPVQLNLYIDDPHVGDCKVTADDRHLAQLSPIEVYEPEGALPATTARELADTISNQSPTLVAAGGWQPDARLDRALSKLYSFGNYAVTAEWMSNLHHSGFVTNTDVTVAALRRLRDNGKYLPARVITYGTPLLSSQLGVYIKENGIEHWHVGTAGVIADPFGTVTRHYRVEPAAFFGALAAITRRNNRDSIGYGMLWSELSQQVDNQVTRCLNNGPWCDNTAIYHLLKALKRPVNLQLSNGMTTRYVNVMSTSLARGHIHRCDANRGVSGIDGSTSTAAGAAWGWEGTTLLVSGDMSAQYDMGALATAGLSPRFKMAVINNGGGKIFGHIATTRDYSGVDTLLSVPGCVLLEGLAAGCGIAYYRADSLESLHDAAPQFLAPQERPAILEIVTRDAPTVNFHRTLYDINP